METGVKLSSKCQAVIPNHVLSHISSLMTIN